MAYAHTGFIIDKSDLAQFKAVLKKLNRNVAAPQKFLNAVGELIIVETMHAFEQERDPNTGKAWVDLKPGTRRGRKKGEKKSHKVTRTGIRRRAGARHVFGSGVFKSGLRKGMQWEQSYKILQDTGVMRGSLTKQVSMLPPAVAVGFSDKKAPWHQFGVKQHNLPARPMLPMTLTPKLRAAIMKMLIAQVRNGIGGYVR